MSWVLGLDGGGSKTALAYANREGEVMGPFYAPGINPFDQPEWEAGLSGLLRAHPAPGPLSSGPLSYATLGLPGYGESPTISSRQHELASELLPCPLSVLNDVEAAFVGAFAGGPGALLLAGTGSMAWAGNGGRQVRSGGWGEGFGDEGSAYWIGRGALSLASQALDGRHPDLGFAERLLTPLFGHLSDQAQLLDWYYGLGHVRSGVAALARTVDALAEAGQPTALTLLEGAAEQLARHVQAARHLLGAPQLPWSHAGSVLSSKAIQSRLQHLLGGAPLAPVLSPLGGALFHAARRAGFATSPEWRRRVSAALIHPHSVLTLQPSLSFQPHPKDCP